MKIMNYLMGHLLHQISYFEYIINKYETLTDNSSIRIYVNKRKKNYV